MRRILTRVFLLAALTAFAAASALAQNADRMRVAPGPVAVRENPSNGSPKVMSLKAGQRVRIDYEADGWVAVFPPEQKNRAESSALGYVRLGDLRLAGPLDLRRDGSPADKDEGRAAPQEKKKAEKPKTAAEKKREAREAKAAAEKVRRDAKALKASPKGALTRDEMLATPQQKATVRTSSVLVEKSVDKSAEQKAPDAKPADAKPADAKSPDGNSVEAAARLADQKAAQAPRPAPPRPAPPKPAAPKEEDFGVIRVPDRPLAVRAARNKDSEFKKLLQPGQRVRTDMQADGFYAVFAPEERVRDIKRAWGYGRDKYLLTEKEFAVRGAAYPPTNATDAPAPAPEAKPEARPEPAPPAPPVPSVDPKKPSPQPEQKNATAVHSAAPVAPGPAQTRPAAPPAPANGSAAAQASAPVAGEEVLGYALLERREDPLRPLAPVLLRVRLETPYAPAQETLRRVAREIWKAERRKADEVVLEVYLTGMDTGSLAYAVARFAPDGRIRELYWRDALVPRKR